MVEPRRALRSDPVAQAVLLDGLGAVDALLVRREALERQMAALVPDSPWAQTIGRLRCLRGIDTLSALGLAAEVGDFSRFERPGQLMSFLGLVPSEHSSGDQRRQGSITKSGSEHGPPPARRGGLALSTPARAWARA